MKLKIGNRIRTVISPQLRKDIPEAVGVEGKVVSKPYVIGDEHVIEVVYKGNTERSIVLVNEIEKIEESKFSVGSEEYMKELVDDTHEYFSGLDITPTPGDIEDNMVDALSKEGNMSSEEALVIVKKFLTHSDIDSKEINQEIRAERGKEVERAVEESEEISMKDKHNLKEGDIILVRSDEKGAPLGEDGIGEIVSFDDDKATVKVDNKEMIGLLDEIDDIPVVMIQTEAEYSEATEEPDIKALAEPVTDAEKEVEKKFVADVLANIKKKDYIRLMTVDTGVLYCGVVGDITKKGIKIDDVDNLLIGKITVEMLNIDSVEKVENSEVAIRVTRLTVNKGIEAEGGE